MKALVINCSPVRTGATAKIVRIITEKLSERSRIYADFQKKDILLWSN